MLGALDHVGYLARDFERSLAEVSQRLGMPLVRRFERPRFSLLGAYLGDGEGSVEVFTFTDRDVLHERLPEGDLVLDHVAYATPDIRTVAAHLREQGVRFSRPDYRGELTEPADLGGVLHLWTVPASCGGQAIQLLQRA
jgi:catechol 2,3-dioxygenase-like lactoylglutathione lyase family enzyme